MWMPAAVTIALLCLPAATVAAGDHTKKVPAARDLNAEAADLLIDGKQAAKARAILEQALQATRLDDVCRTAIEANLGTAWWYSGDSARALEHLQKALVLLRQEKARQPNITGQEVTIRFDPGDRVWGCHSADLNEANLLARIGQVHLQNERTRAGIEKAKDTYDEILRVEPGARTREEILNLRIDIADEAFRQVDYATAAEAAQGVLRDAAPRSFHQHHANRVLADIASKNKQYADAVRFFQAALAVPVGNGNHTGNVHLYRGLSANLLAMDQRAEALTAADSAIIEAKEALAAAEAEEAQAANNDEATMARWKRESAAQDQAAALFERAALHRYGKPSPDSLKAAAADYREARTVHPDRERIAKALEQEGWIATELRDWDAAIGTYEKLVDLVLADEALTDDTGIDSLRDLRVKLAAAAIEGGRPDYATEVLQEALVTRGNATEREIHRRIGLIAYGRENYAAARDAFLQALASPGPADRDRSMREMLANCYLQQKPPDFAAAASAGEEALRLRYLPEEAATHEATLRNCIYAYDQLRDYRRAITHYPELVRLTGKDQDRIHWGGAYEKLQPPELDHAWNVYADISDAATRFERQTNVQKMKAHAAFCASRFAEAAAGYEEMRVLARDARRPVDAAIALKRVIDMSYAELLREYASAGEWLQPTTSQLERIHAIDARYADVYPSLPERDRRQVILTRGHLADLAWEWDKAKEWYTHPLLTPEERESVRTILDAIERVRNAPRIELGDPVRQYAVFENCP